MKIVTDDFSTIKKGVQTGWIKSLRLGFSFRFFRFVYVAKTK